jgi:hypothetical protein
MTAITLKDAISAACAAQRINGRYIKRYEADKEKGEESNGALMRDLLNPDIEHVKILPQDIESAEQILEYLDSKMFELIGGTLHDYWRNLVLLTEQKEFLANDYKTLALIASVPSSYKNAIARENARDEITTLQANSRHFGKVGDNFEGKVTIISAVFSYNYNKWYHTGLTENNCLVLFPFAEKLDRGTVIILTARIHKHDEDNKTRLHYVRIKMKVPPLLETKKVLDNHE